MSVVTVCDAADRVTQNLVRVCGGNGRRLVAFRNSDLALLRPRWPICVTTLWLRRSASWHSQDQRTCRRDCWQRWRHFWTISQGNYRILQSDERETRLPDKWVANRELARLGCG